MRQRHRRHKGVVALRQNLQISPEGGPSGGADRRTYCEILCPRRSTKWARQTPLRRSFSPGDYAGCAVVRKAARGGLCRRLVSVRGRRAFRNRRLIFHLGPPETRLRRRSAQHRRPGTNCCGPLILWGASSRSPNSTSPSECGLPCGVCTAHKGFAILAGLSAEHSCPRDGRSSFPNRLFMKKFEIDGDGSASS